MGPAIPGYPKGPLATGRLNSCQTLSQTRAEASLPGGRGARGGPDHGNTKATEARTQQDAGQPLAETRVLSDIPGVTDGIRTRDLLGHSQALLPG